MWFARTVEGFRAWFSLKTRAGNIRTGALPGNFMVTVVNPSDTASTTAAVTESVQRAGLYSFLVPSAFLIAHGVGEYGVVVQVTVPGPGSVKDVFSDVLTVSLEDLDSLGASIMSVPGTVATQVWSEIVDGATTAEEIMRRINSYVRGRVVVSGDDVTYYAEDGSTIVFINRKLSDTKREPQ